MTAKEMTQMHSGIKTLRSISAGFSECFMIWGKMVMWLY